ncbi:MAG: hypothetical protein IPO05_12590 [Flavobacteriales bacterium]|nr:hypothetical protein [Flavobacteriales bacterium]MBK9514425.1 hypothetical protein [Flavobacteriales bacterium]
MRFLVFIISSLTTLTLLGQHATDDNLVFWNSARKLTVDDFGIKTMDNETNSSFAQFSVDYQVSGFDFMTKNFNKKVRNYLIRSASTIDTTSDVTASLRYQQTLFDICEIYTRQFRKALKENRKKIASGTQFIDGLNQKAMTDFSNRRVQYDRDSNFGTIKEKQIEWEDLIKKELNELNEFANE